MGRRRRSLMCRSALALLGCGEEFDSLGTVGVPAARYWGAQTQRSLQHFNIGNDRMPKEVYHAYGVCKGGGGRQHPGGPITGLEGRPDRAGVRRGDQPATGSGVPALCVADRIRDPVEHERE